MPKITHIIYDFDGLLLDTEPIHHQVNSTMAAGYGKTFTGEVHSKIIGRTALDSAQLIVEMLDLPLTPVAYLQQRDNIIYDLYPAAQPMPGAMALTQHLQQHHIPQAIATSSSVKSFQRKTVNYQDWLELFACIVLGDDSEIKQGKPAPDSFLVTAKRLEANPSQCLVFEDSLAGVTAAKEAGMFVVAIPAKEMNRSEFAIADEVLDSLLQFEPSHWDLPAFTPSHQMG